MNIHDSERMAGLLDAAGYEPTNDEAGADVIVLNTCSVRERGEDKLFSRLGEIRERVALDGTDPIVAVTGCVAQQEGAKLIDRMPFVDVVAGTQSLKRLPALIEQARASSGPTVDISPHEDVSFPLGIVRHSDPVRAKITIIEGCNEYCSFCVVPYTRGHERMRPVADILDEARQAAQSGRREVILLGQIVNHYQAPDDERCDFAELLARVSAIAGIDRIRFASPHPRHVSDRLIEAIRDLPQVCKHLHLPVQSGSDRMLQLMRRRYSRSHFLELVDRARATVPGIAISTDIIVGFPGETSEDFELTMDLSRRANFQSMCSFKYSPRPKTLALKRMADDVPEAEKTRRIMALQQLQREAQAGWHQSLVGQTLDVFVDARSRRREWELAGRTSGNTVVNFPGSPDWLGQIVPVTITEAAPNTLRGAAVEAMMLESRC